MRDDGYCSMFSLKPGSWLDVEPELSPCARDGLDRFDTIVVGLWPPNGPPWTPSGSVALDYIHEHRKLHARARFGYDRWAGLKTRLTGMAARPLDHDRRDLPLTQYADEKRAVRFFWCGDWRRQHRVPKHAMKFSCSIRFRPEESE